MTKQEAKCLTAFWQKWGGNVAKVSMLTLHNLKKDKKQYISFGIIILLTALILNSALTLLFQVDKAYDKKFCEQNTANINLYIPKTQDTDILNKYLIEIDGVKDLENREALMALSTIKDFRGTDFSISTVFYDKDDTRKFNLFTVTEKSNKDFKRPVYIPLYISQFGEFNIGDKITFQIDGKNYDFDVAGIIEEMQYGNAGNGALGIYLPNDIYKDFSEELSQNKITEYSLITDKGVAVESIKNEAVSRLSDENINLMYTLDSNSCKQTRTMVSSLLIIILAAFSFVILLVSMFLSKFRIQNTIEEEITSMGVQKAIGYTGNMIIFANVLPYLIVSAFTSMLGVLASYIILPVLSQVLALQSGFSFELYFDITAFCLTILALVGITLLFTYLASRRIRKLQPINAIRGNSESRHGNKNHFPLDKAKGSIQISLMLKQMASGAKQNVLLFIVSFLLTVLLAFTGTLFFNAVIKPDNFTTTLSEEVPDITLQVKAESIQNVKKSLSNEKQVEKLLEYSVNTVNMGSGSIKAFICEDFSAVTNDLCYDGRNPEKDNEIAIGSKFKDEYSVGDKIQLEYGDNSYTYDIVGFIQSVNFQGEVCELTPKGYMHIDKAYDSGSMYVYLIDGADTETVLKEIENKYTDDIIKSTNTNKMTKTSQEMYAGIVVVVVATVFILTVLIVLLILYIIIKSLIVRRKQELGIYKAMGYSNRQLIMQIAGSFLPVSIIGILSSALLGILYLPVINNGIFQAVGAMKNNFEISIVFLLLIAFLQIFINFIISIFLSMPVRKISAYSLIKE